MHLLITDVDATYCSWHEVEGGGIMSIEEDGHKITEPSVDLCRLPDDSAPFT